MELNVQGPRPVNTAPTTSRAIWNALYNKLRTRLRGSRQRYIFTIPRIFYQSNSNLCRKSTLDIDGESASSTKSTNREAHAINGSLKPHPPKPSLNPQTPASTTPTPLGTLSVLPRELRDEIYSHVCEREYEFGRFSDRLHRKWHSNGNTDLPMLTLSKTIREELLAVLHAEAVFSIRSARYFQNKAWTRNDIPFIDHIQRVGLSTAVCALSDEHCNESMLDLREANEQLSKMRAEPTSFFAGTEVPRKTCVIEFILCTPKTMLILQSPLFDAIKHLTGFKTVTLKISSIREHWGPQDALIYIGEDTSFMDHAVGFAAIIDAIGSALEPSLGPNVISEAIVLQGIGWKITFHPRDYLSKQEKPEAGSGAQLEEAADTLTALKK